MKTKPFDLELAIQGHPLCDDLGKEVKLLYVTDKSDDYPVICEVGGGIKSFTANGMLFKTHRIPSLFLLDCEWQPAPKEGDLVLVSNGDSVDFCKQIYLFTDKNGIHHCLSDNDAYLYNNKRYGYSCSTWKLIKTFTHPTIDITVKVNGKEVPLSTISEETLLNIRKNS